MVSATRAASPRVLLVRHGETEGNRLSRCQGWTDEPLNANGREQAVALAAELARHAVARVVASPLSRARTTAETIAKHHAVAVDLHDDLRELYHGRLEGVPFDELDNHVPGIRDAWRTRPHMVHMPGGETLAELQRRATAAFDGLASPYLAAARNGGPCGDLLVVAHALTIGTIMCRLEGLGLEHVRRFRLQPCGYWLVESHGSDWRTVASHRPMPDEIRP